MTVKNLSYDVYLAGPMEGLTHEQMTEWRVEATEFFNARFTGDEEYEEPIYVRDPTSRESYREQAAANPANVAKRITLQDIHDIEQSRVVLINLQQMNDLNLRCWGSISEMVLAWKLGIPVIMIFPEGHKMDHPFVLTMATEVHDNLADALKATASYFR
jgi:nucleoside 2-deoxyribosyltransferase